MVQKMNGACEVEEITDRNQIAAHGRVQLPAVFIDGKLVFQGEGVSREKAGELIGSLQPC